MSNVTAAMTFMLCFCPCTHIASVQDVCEPRAYAPPFQAGWGVVPAQPEISNLIGYIQDIPLRNTALQPIIDS
jgi:hypothetical protein